MNRTNKEFAGLIIIAVALSAVQPAYGPFMLGLVVVVGLAILMVRLGRWLTLNSSLTEIERDDQSVPKDAAPSRPARSPIEQAGRVYGVGERKVKSLRQTFNEGRAQTNGDRTSPTDP